MPTTNPRVQVTLSPTLDALVRRLAMHQRLSKSQVLRELLEVAEPALQRAVALMEAASSAQEQAKAHLARSLGKATDRAEVSLAQVFAGLDAATADLVAQAEAVRGRRPPRKRPARSVVGAEGAPNPPASNRGVKSRKTGQSVTRVRGRR